MILDKYRHLVTPSVILESLESAKPKRKTKEELQNFHMYTEIIGGHARFLEDSLRHRKEKGQKSNVIPFNTYFPTFDTMDNFRKQFYFHWRKEASEGRFLDTELSYIFLFSYELINYGYNSEAAFNISMLEQLYHHYIRRYPKLERYLPVWIADFLFELGELDLAAEWATTGDDNDSEYESLKEMENSLQSISITTWWKFIPDRSRSPFFTKHKTKIYGSFKECVVYLHNQYREEDSDKGIFDYLYTEQEVFVKRELFTAAILARNTVSQGVSIAKRVVNKEYGLFLSQIMRLAENFQREKLKNEVRLSIDPLILPKSIAEELFFVLNQSTRKSRFVKVSSESADRSLHSLPKDPRNIQPLDIVLDANRILELSKDSDELKRIFEEKYSEDETNRPLEMTPLTEEVVSIDSIFKSTQLEDDQVKGFIESLTELEVTVLIKATDGNLSVEGTTKLLKEYGVMIGTFLINLNEKAESFLEEVFLEEDGEQLEVTEEFLFILKLLGA